MADAFIKGAHSVGYPEYRGQGIGKMLLAYMFEQLRELGYRQTNF
jgi:GNAT superfamily N-acetyltransferase